MLLSYLGSRVSLLSFISGINFFSLLINGLISLYTGIDFFTTFNVLLVVDTMLERLIAFKKFKLIKSLSNI